MTTATKKTTPERILNRVRAGLADMRYAQQRVFENRTGLSADSGHDRRRTGIRHHTS